MGESGWSSRGARWRLGSSCLAVALLVGGQAVAQKAGSARLTVRPREMATGAVTTAAGVQPFDSVLNYLVYVPKTCVGKERVPLVVYLPGGGGTSDMVLNEQRDLADKYGMILLAPQAQAQESGWDILYKSSYPGYPGLNPERLVTKDITSPYHDVRAIDSALKLTLQKYAIDPEKIAVAGFSDGGSYALFLGRNNEDVFSRVVGISPFEHFDGSAGPRNPKTRFLVAGGVAEGAVVQVMSITNELRMEGHDSVETVLALRGHTNYLEDNNYVWGWLARSWDWKAPDGTAPVPRFIADTDPILTTDIVSKMTTFWANFKNEHDSIRNKARKANQEVIAIMVGEVPVTVVKANMKFLAQRYPSVVADLKQAGLTVEEEERYRIALVRALFASHAKTWAGTIPEGSVLGKNVAFWAQTDDLDALIATNMFETP